MSPVIVQKIRKRRVMGRCRNNCVADKGLKREGIREKVGPKSKKKSVAGACGAPLVWGGRCSPVKKPAKGGGGVPPCAKENAMIPQQKVDVPRLPVYREEKKAS